MFWKKILKDRLYDYLNAALEQRKIHLEKTLMILKENGLGYICDSHEAMQKYVDATYETGRVDAYKQILSLLGDKTLCT